jgi:hypothetical protein
MSKEDQKKFKDRSFNKDIKKEEKMAGKKCKTGYTRSKRTKKCIRKPRKRIVSKRAIRKFFGG